MYKLTGAQGAEGKVKMDGEKYVNDLDTVTGFVKSTYGAVSSFGDSGKTFEDYTSDYNTFKQGWSDTAEVLEEPKNIAIGAVYKLLNGGIQTAKDTLARVIIQAMTESYLRPEGGSARDYLLQYGVVDGKLDFSQTRYLDPSTGEKLIDVVCTYDVRIPILNLFGLKTDIPMANRVTVAAWTKGDAK